jgi:hypothetical protein
MRKYAFLNESTLSFLNEIYQEKSWVQAGGGYVLAKKVGQDWEFSCVYVCPAITREDLFSYLHTVLQRSDARKACTNTNAPIQYQYQGGGLGQKGLESEKRRKVTRICLTFVAGRRVGTALGPSTPWTSI